MTLSFDILLYLHVAAALSYLIYRYARYSRWRSTDAGRAFMTMKLALMSLVLFGLGSTADPDGDWRPIVRRLVVSAILGALLYQVSVIIRRQGGWRRKQYTQDQATIDSRP